MARFVLWLQWPKFLWDATSTLIICNKCIETLNKNFTQIIIPRNKKLYIVS